MTDDDELRMRIEADRAYIRGSLLGLSTGLATTAAALASIHAWAGVTVLVVAGALHCLGTWGFRPTWLQP